MDNYNNNKEQLLNLPLQCKKYDSWIDITTVTGGSGGSKSIILIGKVDDIDIVLKCTPLRKKRSFFKDIPNNDLVEIEIYKYLSNKYLDSGVTPHIVGIYQHKKCPDIKTFFRKKCPTMLNLLTDKKLANQKDDICDFNRSIDLFQNKLHLLLLEYCPLKIDNEFEKLIKKYKKKKLSMKVLEDFVYRVIFQIMFTLSQLQQNEKQFFHGDLFLRNILGTNECLKGENDYVEYIFNNKKFYLPANGFYAKMSDFGTTVIHPKFISNNVPNKEFYWDNKTDVFAFLRDMYDGENLGAMSLIKLMKDNKMNNKDIKKIKNIFKKFIDVDTIDKMNSINKKQLDRIWYIKKYSFLKKLVKEPKQYMTYDLFDKYKELPKNGKIVKSFGKMNMTGGSSKIGSIYEYKYYKYKTKYLFLKEKEFGLVNKDSSKNIVAKNKYLSLKEREFGLVNRDSDKNLVAKNKYIKLKQEGTSIFQKEVDRIIEIAKNINVLAMGEATHGQDRIKKFSINVFKQLVEKAGYTVFVLEDQYSCCELINDFIKGRLDADPRHLMGNLMWPWYSKDMLELVKWMKKYNERNGNILKFKGLDIMRICKDYKGRTEVSEFVKKLNEAWDKVPFNDKEEDPTKSDMRDKYMYDVFMKMYNPNKRYFLYFHNGHVRKSKEHIYTRMGQHLHKKFGKKYYVIGNSFVKGSYAGNDFRKKNNFKLDIAKIDKPVADDFKEGLTERKNVTDFDDLVTVEGGAAVFEDEPYRFLWENKINGGFDAIMVINNEKPLDSINWAKK